MRDIKAYGWLMCLVAVGFFVLSPIVASAMEEHPMTCSPLKLSSGTVALGLGYSWGHGTLDYNGKKHPFKIEGLNVGSIGMHEASSTGKVCNLTKLEDLNGKYAGVFADATVGGGASAMTLRNQNGVIIDVTSATQGVSFSLAPSGVNIQLER
jgi:hypothetical protein